MSEIKFGLVIPNRGPLVGLFTPRDLVRLVELADSKFPAIDAVWVGDSILAKPRFECNTLLAVVAERTRNVKLGPACFASFPLRQPLVTALEWASIDALSGGRTIWPVCLGGNPKSGGSFQTEYDAFGVDPSARIGRLVEGIQILKLLWTEDNATFQGKHFRFQGVTLEPKPAQKPRPPIWLVATPTRKAAAQAVDRMMRRVVRHADGWMTTRIHPEDFAYGLDRLRELAAREGVDGEGIEPCLYYNVLVNPDRKAARAEAKAFLDAYYMTDFSAEELDLWTAMGSPQECAETINRFVEAGVRTFSMRFPSRDQEKHLDLFLDQVLPHFE